MTCPYCGKEMEQGYIKSAQRLFWSKEKEMGIEIKSVQLSQNFWNGFFNGFFIESHYCTDCKKIITSIK